MVTCNYICRNVPGERFQGNDQWWVVIEEISAKERAAYIPHCQRRVANRVECGFAARVLLTPSTDNSTSLPEPLAPSFFSTLPLPEFSHIPMYIHATFVLSGDRQALLFDELAAGRESQECRWNRYLLEDALPKMYLKVLEDLGPNVPNVLKYFPVDKPPNKSCGGLLEAAFWGELVKSSRRVFPKAQSEGNFLEISRAIFDFLSKVDSDLLAPFLHSVGVELVCPIARGILRERLADLEITQCVSGPFLAGQFKSDNAILELQDAAQKEPAVLDTVLKLILHKPDLDMLDGCGVVPLEDGDLGKLRVIVAKPSETDCDTPNHAATQFTNFFIIDPSLTQLFGFASDLIVSSKIVATFKEILESKRFNMKRLALSDFPSLLEKRLEPPNPNRKETAWLLDFWKTCNNLALHAKIPAFPGLSNFRLYLVTCDNVESYVNESELAPLPAIVQPIEEYQGLCGSIPGLYLIHQSIGPHSLQKPRSFKNSPVTFGRLSRRYGL